METGSLVLSVSYGLLCAFGSLLNLIVVCLILFFRPFRTLQNVPVFQICLSGFFYCSGLPFLLILHKTEWWVFGDASCKIIMGLESIAKFCSVFFVTIAALERYFAVCKNTLYRRCWSFRKAVFVSLVIWLFCAALVIPVFQNSTLAFVEANSSNSSGGYSCLLWFPESIWLRSFTIYMFCFVFLLPSGGILFSYLQILRKISNSSRRLKNYKIILSRTAYSNEQQHPLRRQGVRQRRGRSSRANKLVPSLIICFLICWTPYWVFNFCSVFDVLPPTQIISFLYNVVHMMTYLSCVLNPALYLFLTGNFKEEVQKKTSTSSGLINRLRLHSELINDERTCSTTEPLNRREETRL